MCCQSYLYSNFAFSDLWVLQSRHKHCDVTTDVTSPALREEELEALERHFLIDDVASCFATSLATDAETSLDDPSSEVSSLKNNRKFRISACREVQYVTCNGQL